MKNVDGLGQVPGLPATAAEFGLSGSAALYPTGARDSEFTATQSKAWFEPGYRAYFGGPPTDKLEFITHPPAGYCSDDQRVAYARC